MLKLLITLLFKSITFISIYRLKLFKMKSRTKHNLKLDKKESKYLT